MACLSQCPSLAELTLDGNPLSNSLDHRQAIISHLHCLKLLDQLPILVGRGGSMGVILKGFTEKILLTPLRVYIRSRSARRPWLVSEKRKKN